jgi:hypothetical protein
VKALCLHYLKTFGTYLIAPIYFHFGHYAFMMDLMTIAHDMADTLGIYFLNFIIISAFIFYRNFFFQLFNKLFFKNYNLTQNNTPFLNYFNLFFNNLRKLVSTFFKKLK